MDNSNSRSRVPIPFMPIDAIFQILLWLPAEVLHTCARYVCKSWSVIVSDSVFIKEHHNRSKSGLVFQIHKMPIHGKYLDLGDRGFEVVNIDGLFNARLVSRSRGLSLFYKTLSQNVLYVGNLTTRKFETLPCPISRKERFLGCHIAFVPESSQYKVLYCVNLNRVCKWRVWTLGNDHSWRNLDLPSTVNLNTKIGKISASVNGVLYLSMGKGATSAIDLTHESGYLVQSPHEFADKIYWLHEMKNDLSCLVNQKGEIHVFILTDLISSEWLKVFKLGEVVDKRRYTFRSLVPVGWLRNGEKLVFIIREPGCYRNRCIMAYDIKTGDCVIHEAMNLGEILTHTNSLITW